VQTFTKRKKKLRIFFNFNYDAFDSESVLFLGFDVLDGSGELTFLFL
jgi:hypothetical protein